jgi:hypothetical protein
MEIAVDSSFGELVWWASVENKCGATWLSLLRTIIEWNGGRVSFLFAGGQFGRVSEAVDADSHSDTWAKGSR